MKIIEDCEGCKYELLTNKDYPCSSCVKMCGVNGQHMFEPKYKTVGDLLADKPDIHKADAGKAQLTLVPRAIIWAIAKVRMYGVNVKYPETGRDGWKTIGKQRIRDAMYRHMLRYLDDPHGVDEESGLPHLWHLACNIAFLCEMEKDSH